MNTTLFSFFLLITLGFSIFSASGTTGNIWNTPDNTQFTVNLTEGLELSSDFSQNIDNNHSIMLSEQLELLNHDRYQSMVTASKHISDTKAIMERVLPNTRLRLTDSDNLVGSGSNTSISGFIETITDTFYQGGAKTPSLPMIPIEITTTGTGVSLQTLQLMDTSQNGLEPSFDNTGQSWSEPIQYNKNQYASKIFLVDSIEEFSSSLSEINPPKLDSTVIILIVTFPFAIYVILIAEGIVRPPSQPKIPQYASFYFVFVCFVSGTFATPFSIGQSYWGTAYGEMDNSTDNSTNSTDITNPEYISVNLTDEEESTVSPLQNATLTETDNVADSDGPKHYTVSLSEALNIGDGPSNETQNPNESTTQQTTVSSENSTNTQISESISFFDYVTSDQQAAISSENSTGIQISEYISFFDYSTSDQQAAISSENSTGIQISEYISFFDYSTSDSSIVSDGIINLNEQIEFSDDAHGLSGNTTVKISEHVTFGSDLETVLYTPLRETVEIQEDLSIGTQIAINGVVEITVFEYVEFSEKIAIKAPDIKILEFINFSVSLQNQLALVPLEDIPYLGLLSQDSILILNGTTNVVSDQDIANTTSTLTISAWIKPEFNTGSPQYTIVSKEYSFDLYLTNILEPARTTGFSVFDGAQWKTVSGSTVLDERWHHVVASVAGSNIALYVDGLLEGELELEDGIIIQESQITSDDSDIIIGAYVNTVNIPKASNMFAGMITSVDVYSRTLTAEQVYQKYQTDMQEFYKTVYLYETVQMGEHVYYESPFHVMLDETLELYEFTSENVDEYTFPADTFHVMLDETLELYEFTSENATNTLTISAWIKPEFNTGSPQYTIVSKEYLFDLYLTNILEPARTTGFSVFDGAQWKTVSGSIVLDERWHHVVASVAGSSIVLYIDGLLEGELELEDGIAFDNSELVFQDSQILPDDSDIIIGAYVNTVNVPKTLNKFAGEITSVDVYSRALTAEQVYQKYQTDMQEFYKIVSLYETVQVNEYVHYEVTEFNPFHIQLEEHLAFYDEATAFNPFHIQLEEHLAFYDEVTMSIPYRVHLEEHLAFYDEATAFNPFHIQLEEHLTFYDEATVPNPSHIQLEESLQFDDRIIALNPFVPSVNPEIQMVKSGFLITENPKFELEYYSEDDAAKIDRKEIENATSIANQVQEDLALTPIELLSRPGINEVITALQVIQTSLTISELEDQVEQIPEDVNAEDIKQLQEKVEEVTESIEDTAKSLGETHLWDKAEEIEKSAEMIREAADIRQIANQTGTWQTTDENITTRIIAPDGSIFADEAFFEKEREGKFDVEVLSDAVAKPGIYTVQSTITVDQTEYTINEEFAWGLVSLNTKKSTYYPGETAEFEIVVLDSVGSPVCNASLVMSINGTTLSSGAGITPNSECGIYDSAYDTGMEGTYHVEISAIADGIQTGFETTFDVAEFVEFDIIRTAQSKIDPVYNPNKFEVVIDVTSHTNATDIQIVESVPSVFDVITDGNIAETADRKTITWDRTLQDQTAQIKYTYSVPMIFPELYPLGEAVINYGNQTFTEARPWFVANDPDIGSGWKKKVLSTNPTVISGASDLTNYPVAITLTDDPDLSTSSVGANGVGIRFTSDGTELLDFEIEYYDGDETDGTLVAWVELPNLSASVSTNFYIHYGKTTAQSDAAATAAAVWAGNSYVVVNHLDDTPTSTDNDVEMIGSIAGTSYGGVTTVATDDDFATGTKGTSMGAGNLVPGKISKGLELNKGSANGQFVCLDTENQSDYNGCGGSGDSDVFSGQDSGTFWKTEPANNAGTRSTSLWYKAVDVSGTYQYLFEEGASNGQGIYLFENKIYGCTSRSNDEPDDVCGFTTTTANEWHHVVLVWNDNAADTAEGTGNDSYLYHDGVLGATFTGRDFSSHSNPGALGIVQGSAVRHTSGENTETSPGPYEFDGIIDEFRVTNTELSANLISVTYNTEKNPTDFICEGICLTETLSLGPQHNAVRHGPGENVFLSENINFTDTATTISNVNFPDSWSKKLLSTNSELVAGTANLNRVPILVKLTDDPDLSLTSVGENGMGIRFSSPTWDFLDFEIERYDGDETDGSLVAWVKIPTLDFDDNTPFYIHYGQPIGNGTASASINAVWAGNTAKGFIAVNHLSDPIDTDGTTREIRGSTAAPSVSDANTLDDFSAVNMASDDLVDAKIGKGLDFDGANDAVCLDWDGTESPPNFNCTTSNEKSVGLFDADFDNRTVSLWYNADDISGDRKMHVLYEEGGSGNGMNIYLYEGRLYVGAWKSNNYGFPSIATTANEWHHVALVFSDNSNDNMVRMYYDGQTSDALRVNAFDMGSHSNEDCLGANCNSSEIHVGDSGHSNANDDASQTISGVDYDFSGEFDGTLDEFRVINSVLSAAFIETTYNSENNPSGFILHTTDISLTETLSFDVTATGERAASTTTVSLSGDAAESISFTDTISKSTNKLLTETLSFDVTTTGIELVLLPVETMSFTDSISKSTNKLLTETLSFDVTATGVEDAKEVSLSVETLSFTDSISKSTNKLLTETLSFDVTATGIEDAKEVSLPVETLSFTDTISKSTNKLLTETLSFTVTAKGESGEVSSTDGIATVSLSETLSFDVTTTGTKDTRTVTISETLSFADTISKEAGISISETLSMTDTATGTKDTRTVTISETLSFADTISKAADISISETISMTDTSTGVKDTREVTISETLSFADTISKAADISISETISMTDTSTGVKDTREVTISETLSFADTISKAAGISISETLSMTDTATGVKDTREVTISETLSFADTISKEAGISISETLSMTDTATGTKDTRTVTISETLSFADTISKEAGISISETLSMTDTATGTKDTRTVTISETLSFADTISKAADISISETLSMTDTATGTKDTRTVTISETLSFADTISKAADISMSETLSMTDTATGTKDTRTVTISETLSFADTISKAADISMSETLSMTDTATGTKDTRTVTISETLSFADTISKAADISMSETLSMTDTATGTKDTRTVTISETLSFADTISKAADISISETLSMTDTATGTKDTRTVTISETLSFADTISKAADISMSETLSMTDTSTGVKDTREVTISETLSLTDTISKAADISMSETLSMTDTSTGVKDTREVTISETLSLTDTISKAADISMSETLSMTDTATGVKDTREVTISETLSLTDTISKAADISMSETLSMTDTATGVKDTREVTISETLSLTDTISKAADISISETISMTDTSTGVKDTREVTISETLSFADTISKEAGISISETLSMTDTATGTKDTRTVTISETLSFADTVSKSADKLLSETLAFTDTATGTKETQTITLSETLSFADTISKAADISVSESLALTDTATGTKETQTITLSETLSFADTISKAADISVSESLALTDTATGTKDTRTVSISETLSLTDTISKAADISMSETLSMTDTATGTKDTRTVTISETLSFADTISKAADISISETISMTDTSTGVKDTREVTISETLSFADTISKAADISMSETLSMTDTATGTKDTRTVTISETLSFADSLSKAADISMLETLSMTDTSTGVKETRTVSLSETLSFADTVSKSADKLLSETLSMTDTATGTKDTRTVTISETLSLTDSLSKAADISMSETLSMTDTATGIKSADISLSETLSFADTISKAADISMSETLSLTDTISVDGTVTVALSETLSFTDSLSKSTVISLSELILFTDSVFKSAEVPLSETLSFTDSLSRIGATSVSLSETLSFADTISKAADISMSETLSFTDSISQTEESSISLSETLSFADTISKAAGISISESVSLTDAISVDGTVTVALSETLSFTDSLSKAAKISLSESISLADSTSTAQSVSLSETLSFTDSLSRIGATSVSLSETLSLTDTISKAADISMSESISFTDNLSKTGTASVSISETLSFADTISKAADISISESVSLTDAISVDGTVTVALSETLSFTDSLSKAAKISLSESISLADSTSTAQSVSLSETLSFTDSLSRIGATSVSLSETLSLTDTISKAADISMSESISFDDTATGTKSADISLSETLSFTDSLSKAAGISISETLSMTDAISIDGTVTVALSETLSFTDSPSTILEANIPLSETMSLTDSLSKTRVTIVALNESMSFSDVEAHTSIRNVALNELVSFPDSISIDGTVSVSLSETLSLVDLILVESAPFAPILTAIPVGNQIILSWNQPFNGNLPITDYKIQHSNNNGASWNTINDGVNTDLAFTVLPNYDGCPSNPCINLGVEAKFRMLAVNSMGNGDSSVPVDVTPAASTSMVYNVRILPQQGAQVQALYVNWTVDAADRVDICDYLVYYATNAAGPWTLYDDGKSTGRSATIFGISTFTSTFVKIEPVLCSTGCPDKESEIAWTMPVQMPPSINFFFTATPEDTKVMLDWDAPANNGGSEIIKYQIQIRYAGTSLDERTFMNSTGPHTLPVGAGTGGWVNAFTGIPPRDSFGMYSYMITGLLPFNDYSFAIRAVNAMGEGQWWSSPANPYTKELMIRTVSEGTYENFEDEHIPDDFDYNTPGAKYGEDQEFDETKDFGAGQTFDNNTEFAEGQEFDEDVNFTGQNIQFKGSKFENAETFGAGADFHGTQDFTGANTFGSDTVFTGEQNFGSAKQTFGAGTQFKGVAAFADDQEFAAETKFAPGQTFGSGKDYNFDGVGMEFGSGMSFGKERTFGSAANFTAGTQTFSGTNTFATGTKFASGQTFDGAQNFGASQEFAPNMEFGAGQSFALDFDFNKESMKFGSSTTFCSGEALGKDADFSAGTSMFGGASTFKNGTKFSTGQDFSSYTHTFTDHQTFGAYTGFKSGQSFGGDVAFSGLFDFNSMKGKALEFEGGVDFFMPPSGEPLGIPAGTIFGDDFDRDSMFVDADGDGVNDKRHMFEAGVIFAANTMFPPRTEFVDGFSFDDMNGKAFTFEEGNFMGGAPHFPSGQTIKPGIMWGGAPRFDQGVTLEAGLAFPDNSVFSAGLEMPAGAAPAYGMLLAAITCADADCIPDPSAYLAPGQLLPPGVDPDPIINYITGSNSTFSNPGLGFEMEFESVTKDGKVNVDLQDPATVPGTSEGSSVGKRSIDLSGDTFENVGSIIDVSVDSATTSGLMTVTLPYDEGVLGGALEDDLVLLHYTGGKWVTVSDITIDTTNNTVTGTVASLSPFTVGTQTGTVDTGGGTQHDPNAGQGGGGGGGDSDTPRYEAYPLQIHSVSYDTCDTNMARIVVGPEYDKMDIVVKTSTGFVTAKMVGVDPVSNHVIFEAPLYTDSGTLQVSASVFMDPLFLRANPFVTTLMACAPEPVPEQEQPEREEFQKPDAFITQIQCSVGTTLVDGECIPVQIGVILLLVILFVGLALALPIWQRLRRRVELLEQVEITRRPVEEYVPEVLQKPPEIEIPEPEIETPEPEIEIEDIVQLINSLQEQTIIQDHIHRMQSQLLELTQEERTVQRNLTTILEQVYQEVRPKVLPKIPPQLPLQLLALPAPKRKYTKKKRTLTDEHKAKIAAAKRGHRLTLKTKEKISIVKKGRKMSDEHKAKIAAAKRGRKISDEHKAKIAAAHTGIKHSPQTKQKMSESKKQNKLERKKKKSNLDELTRRYDILGQGENDETT